MKRGKRGLNGEIGKRGISTVIVTVLLIVLTLVLVAIVWAVINRLIIGNTEGISLEKLTLDADIESVGVNETSNNVSILVKRKQGAGEIQGFRFIFYNSTGTEFATTDYELKELESMRFEFHLDMNVSTLIKIALVPLFKSSSGKETLGNVADTYFFKGNEINNIVEEPEPPACTPTTCSALGYSCGSGYANGTCGGTLDCGTCGTGYDCVGGNCVLQTGINCEALGGAKCWYVDNVATGTNSGNDWTNAWQSFANINWGLVLPGDFIYISGGDISKTYRERLVVGASGSFGLPITIKVGQITGHNGQVIIDGENTQWDNLNLNNRKHIIVSGQVSNGIDAKIRMTRGLTNIFLNGATTNIKLLYLEVDNVRYDANDYDALISYSPGTTGSYADFAVDGPIEIAYSKLHDTTDVISASAPTAGINYASAYGQAMLIHDNDMYNIRDDGIAVGLGSVDIYNNTIRDRISPIQGHPDAIQTYGRYYRIYNNYFHGWQDLAGGNSVVYFEADGGDNMNINNNQPGYWMLYNNIIYEDTEVGGTCDAIELGFSDPDWTSLSNVYILNNIILGTVVSNLIMGWGGTSSSIFLNNIYIMNNVFTDEAPSVTTTVPVGNPATWGEIGSGNELIFDDNFYELHLNPSLDTNHKPDNPNDFVVNSGYDWSSLFTTDKDGVSRPQGSAWDIGAYEYNG